jgi:hypothetical protein
VIENTLNEAEVIYNQKMELGLINVSKKEKITINRKVKPEFILILIGHKPSSTVLKRELEEIVSSDEYSALKTMCEIKVARTLSMGYGLYDEYIVPLEDFIKILSK